LVRSISEAIADVSAAGQPFEIIEVEHDGVTNRAFKNAPATLRQLFDLARGVEETFLVYEDEEWTFAEVMREVDALSDTLVHHFGIKKGDRVGIAMRNFPEWVISFAAIISVGAISVSLNAWWTEDELDFAINDSGLALFIGDSERILRASGSCARAGARLLGVRLNENATYADGVERWSDVVVTGVAMPEIDIDANSDATILYTSGTTGFPRGAVSTHGAICQTIMAFSSGAADVGRARGTLF
jgi:long-chain acyl-CoA synthetase